MTVSNPSPKTVLLAATASAFQTSFDAILQLIPDDETPIWIDGRCTPPQISESAPDDGAPTDCAWRGPADTMIRTLSGKRDIAKSFINGRLLISGDMAVMARLELGPQQ